MTRLEKIQSLLAADPDDEFLIYALGMEHRGQRNFSEAVAAFECLISRQPPHVPSFFMAAQVRAEQGDTSSARLFLRNGIEQARLQGDLHAAGEMGEFLASLGAQGED